MMKYYSTVKGNIYEKISVIWKNDYTKNITIASLNFTYLVYH